MQGMYRRNGIADEIKQSFKEGSYLTKLIYINLGVFILLAINNIILKLFFSIPPGSAFSLEYWMELPSNLQRFILQPWSIVTYMFLHADFLHILFNLLVLFWFGRIFLRFLDQKIMLSVYLFGGLIGGILFVALYNWIPYFYDKQGPMVGASGAVMAIVVASATFKPEYEIYLMFFGRVKLKYVALVYVLLDVISLQYNNEGGHIAHLGGALYGYIYMSQYKKGITIMKWFDRLLDGLFTLFKPRKNKIRVSHKRPVDDYEYNAQKVAKQQDIDHILEKISKYGYESLSKKEKEILFKEGQQ